MMLYFVNRSLEPIHVDFHDGKHHEDRIFNILLKIMKFFIKILTQNLKIQFFGGKIILVEISKGSYFFDLHVFKCSETKFHVFCRKFVEM